MEKTKQTTSNFETLSPSLISCGGLLLFSADDCVDCVILELVGNIVLEIVCDSAVFCFEIWVVDENVFLWREPLDAVVIVVDGAIIF